MTKSIILGLAAAAMLLASAVTSVRADEQADELSRTDRLLAGAQKICPVSGKDLTSMGGPVKARVGGRTVFLCCRGCFEGQVQKAHWDQIQANLIAAQGKCPVMDKPLPKAPKSTVVDGRVVFVCCPPCTKKIEADSTKYLGIVDEFLTENLKE